MWDFRFMPHPHDPRERTPCTHWLRGCVRPKRCSGCYGKEWKTISLPLPGIEPFAIQPIIYGMYWVCSASSNRVHH
jgi:hypothetical protein